MSKYTTELRYICEVNAPGETSVKKIIATAAPKIFDFEFPIFDEAYRTPLETKILRHYYTREIGSETVALWKLRLEDKLNLIMPYYNELYKTTTFEFNPIYDVDWTRTLDRKNQGTNTTTNGENSKETTTGKTTNTGTVMETGGVTTNITTKDTQNNETQAESHENTTQTGKQTVQNSDTPQGSLIDIDNQTYLSSASITDNNQTTNSSGTSQQNLTGLQTGNRDETRSDNKETTNDLTMENNGSVQRVGESTSQLNIDTTESYVEHVAGKQGTGSYASYIKEFRETLLNIDAMIIEELQDLFMQIW